jgi:hypothetical protein
MKTSPNLKIDKVNKFALVNILIVMLCSLLFSSIGLTEFYNVSLAGHKSEYPFGPIADNPWYYRNASVYSIYNLVSGLSFLMTFAISVWAILKKKRKVLLITYWATMILLMFTLLSMGIQEYE